MEQVIYEVPKDIIELFNGFRTSSGEQVYRIVNYNQGMEMDDGQALNHFLNTLGVSNDCIIDKQDNQVTLSCEQFNYTIVIDVEGLGDFYSHGFYCRVEHQSLLRVSCK